MTTNCLKFKLINQLPRLQDLLQVFATIQALVHEALASLNSCAISQESAL